MKMMKLAPLALAATLCAGAAQAIPAWFDFDAGPVIDFTDNVEVLEIDSFFTGVVDMAFSGPMGDTFSLDPGFTGAPVVDFAGVVDTLVPGGSLLDNLYFEVSEGGTVMLESAEVIWVGFGPATLEVLMGNLGGTRAGDFGGFALLTIDLLSLPATPSPWETATSFQSYEVAGIIESVSPVPLPAGAWLMLAGLGAAGALRLRRRG